MTATVTNELDEAELVEFVHRFITDLGAAHHAVTVAVGDRLGLYRAVAEAGPATAQEIAAAAGCDERYTAEWLNAQAASGYYEYDPGSGRYHLTPAQRACLADEDSATSSPPGCSWLRRCSRTKSGWPRRSGCSASRTRRAPAR